MEETMFFMCSTNKKNFCSILVLLACAYSSSNTACVPPVQTEGLKSSNKRNHGDSRITTLLAVPIISTLPTFWTISAANCGRGQDPSLFNVACSPLDTPLKHGWGSERSSYHHHQPPSPDRIHKSAGGHNLLLGG